MDNYNDILHNELSAHLGRDYVRFGDRYFVVAAARLIVNSRGQVALNPDDPTSLGRLVDPILSGPTSTLRERGSTALMNGQQSVSVNFATPKTSANWHFLGMPYVVNTTDPSPTLIIGGMLTARSENGFTWYLAYPTDSANYRLEWQVQIDP